MQRLVKQEDLDKYPQLKSQGVSANQHYDFDFLESQTNGTPPIAKTLIPEKDNGKKAGKKK